MRTSSIITVSLPPALVVASQRVAKKQHMTRSELLRTALRRFLDEQKALEAIAIYQQEQKAGKLRSLKGSLANLL